jgi:hypothetical protein
MRTYPAISRRPLGDEGLRRGCSSGSSGSHVVRVLSDKESMGMM